MSDLQKEDELQSQLDKVKIADSTQDEQENGNESTPTTTTTTSDSSAQNPGKKKKKNKKNKKKKPKVPSLSSCPVQEKLENALLDFINENLSSSSSSTSNATPPQTMDLHELTLEKLQSWPNLDSGLNNLLDIFLSTGSSPPKSLCRSKMTVTLPKADDAGPGLLENVSAASRVPPITYLINKILTARCIEHFDMDNKYCIFPMTNKCTNPNESTITTSSSQQSSDHHVSIVKSIIRQSLQSSSSTSHYFVLINIEDFYESVSHDVLVDAFKSQAKSSLPPSYPHYIKNYLSLSTSVVRVAEWNVDQELHEDSGLISLGEDSLDRQNETENDGLCPFLFNLVLKQILENMKKVKRADDDDANDENFLVLPHLNSILLMGKNKEDVSKGLESFVNFCSSLGLEVDAGECQSLSLEIREKVPRPILTPQFTINGVKISTVNLVDFLKVIIKSSP